MKDFDEKRRERSSVDRRTFRLGGETFVMVAGLRPEVLARFDDEERPEATPEENLARMDEMILGFVETDDDAHARYRALRAREDDPVTIADMEAVLKWMVEEQTGRPTGPPSVSSPGLSLTGTASTAGSSLPVMNLASTG